jgi:hypothetical protein
MLFLLLKYGSAFFVCIFVTQLRDKADASRVLNAMSKLASDLEGGVGTKAWFKTTTAPKPFADPSNYPYAERDEVAWNGQRKYGWGVLDLQASSRSGSGSGGGGSSCRGSGRGSSSSSSSSRSRVAE